MLKKTTLSGGILSLILTAGCTSKVSKSHLKEELREAIGQTKDDWHERKSEFISKSEIRLNDLNNDLYEMKKTNHKMKRNKRRKVTKKVDSALELVRSTREELFNLRNVRAEKWQSEKNSFLSKMNILESKFSEARNYYYK